MVIDLLICEHLISTRTDRLRCIHSSPLSKPDPNSRVVSTMNPQTAYVGVEVGPFLLTTTVIANGANIKI